LLLHEPSSAYDRNAKDKAMMKQIKNRFQQFRRRTFPSSNETSTQRHNAVMTHFDNIEQRLAISLLEIERRLEAVETIERRLTALPEIERKLDEVSKAFSDLEFLLTLSPTQALNLVGDLKLSKSQLRQDIFVLAELGLKKNGFFVEFGATNGIELSNTYLLERKYGWTGILAEPAKCWHDALQENRKCSIETKCVWKESNATLVFSETDMPELSTINSYAGCDEHVDRRKNSENYNVETISLADMLRKYNAPKIIDYLSIDTEGSEFEILRDFDFDTYEFKIITCEHNFTNMRRNIYDLLLSKGYIRKFENLSRWDDWYVKM
jgi:FkbM family methyltransferase